MATYRDLCVDALIASTAVGALGTPTSEEVDYALKQLNRFMASKSIQPLMPVQKKVLQATSSAQGVISLKFDQTTPDQSNLQASIGKVQNIVAGDTNSPLQFLDFVRYASTNAVSSNHSYWSQQAGSDATEQLIYTRPNLALTIIADSGWTPKYLDTLIDFPEYYYGFFEYAVASILCSSFKIPAEIAMRVESIYNSRKAIIEGFNFQLSPLNQSASPDGNFANGYDL